MRGAKRRERFRRLIQFWMPIALKQKGHHKTDRILHVLFSRHQEFSLNPFSLSSGGAARFATEIAQKMALKKKTRLILCSTGSTHIKRDNLEVCVLKSSELRDEDPWTWNLVRHLVWADVVHCHQFEQLGAAWLMTLARLFGKRVYASDLGAYQDRKFWHENDLFRLVHRFLFMSGFSVHTTLPEKDVERATVVGGGYDAEVFSPPTSENGRGGVLYVGRLMPHKGIDILIEAMPTNVSLRIIGPLEPDKAYLSHLRQIAKGKNVSFVGLKQGEELGNEYRRSKICVLPSVTKDYLGNFHPRSELFGLCLAEAQACGTPVICTNVGGMPEAMVANKTGLVVPEQSREPLKRAILRLLENQHLWNQMSAAAITFARDNFQWSKVVDRCLDDYQKGDGS